MGFASFVVRRGVNAFITILLLILLVFLLLHVILPSPLQLARVYAPNPRASPAILQLTVKKFGLADPLYQQFYNYVSNLLHGNFGTDTQYSIPEAQVIAEYLPVTLELVVVGQIIGVLIGLYTGAIAAANRNRTADYGVKAVYLTAWGAPVFLVGFIAQVIFAYGLNLFPATQIVDPTLAKPHVSLAIPFIGPPIASFITNAPVLDGLFSGDWTYAYSAAQHLVLPALTVAVVGFGSVTRLTRATMVDALDKDYVKLAYMKGLSRTKVVWGTAFRNAIIPIITLIALIFAGSAGGAVIVEDVFAYHGMGYFTVQAIYNLDFPAILAFTVIIGLSVIVANFIADVMYGAVDPRVRLS